MRFDDTSSLSHTTWECKYHIVFAPKFRRKAIYGKIKRDIGIINITASSTGGYIFLGI